LVPITFNFASQDFVLPSPIVYGIAFNTSDYGPAPGGPSTEGDPFDSLNVALSTESTDVTVGHDTTPGTAYVDGTEGDNVPGEVSCSSPLLTGFNPYPTAATGSCGFGPTSNIPAVQFNVVNPGLPALYPGGSAQPINFTITNPGSVPAHVGSVTVSVAADPVTNQVESTPGDLNTIIPGCYANWFLFNNDPVVENTNFPIGPTDFLSISTGLSIYMIDSGNQDACEGANIGLVFASS
jgi:hypothetical protein